LYRSGFIIEQALGHITYGQNLQKNVVQDPTIDATWALPSWETSGIVGLVPNWTFRASWQARQAIAAMQRQAPLDVLFFHTQITAVLAQDWLRRIPSVISLDATAIQYDLLGEFYEHHQGPPWIERWKYRMDRNCFKGARHVVTWSDWAKQGLIDDYGVLADKITVIPPGVNLQEWNQSQSRRRENKGPVKILFVGGDFKRKGGFVLLEAFRALRQEFATLEDTSINEKIELHLVTQGDILPEPGVYIYHDMQPNTVHLKQLYHESDIFCLPTYGDCFPIVLSEAAAAGLPIVSTQVAAIPEIVHNGKTGFLVPAGDVLALKKMLKNLILSSDIRIQQGEYAAAFAKTHFDAQKNAFILLGLLKQTADEAKR
jgi:glycosyltransferase involved in cell wall biosynthesis